MVILLFLIFATAFFLCEGLGVPYRGYLRSWTSLGYACWTLALLVYLNPGGLLPQGG